MKFNLTNTGFSATFKSTMLGAITVLTGSTALAQHSNNEKIHIGLFYPISSNGSHAPRDTNKFSLNLIAGVSGSETGFTMAGISNVVNHNAHGAQFAGFSNHVGQAASGAMFAGFLNTYGSSTGFTAAGFANIAKTSSNVQMAGFINNGGNVTALQVAGFVNAAHDVKGTQIAGFVNQARNIKGTQIAGFINHAKNVQGVQLAGFINVADTADVQIGLINIAKNGEMSIGFTIDENRTVLLNFRSGGHFMYGILGAGYNFKNKKMVYAYEAGLGAHLIDASVFRLNAELTETALLEFNGGEYYKSSFALMPAIRLGDHVELFGGPSFNYVNTDVAEGQAMNKKYIRTWGAASHQQNFQGLYVGYTAGIAVRIK